MLELKTKWMTNTLAKESIQKKDFILCHNGDRLFIVGYGEITSSGKNTYNYEVKDMIKNVVISSGENTYLDALTKIILGTSPKTKANKEAKDNNMKAKAKVCNDMVNEFKRLEDNLRKAILAFNDFKMAHDVVTLHDVITLQAKQREDKRKAKQDARREELAILNRIASLRRWAKETKRLDLLQALNEKLLEM